MFSLHRPRLVMWATLIVALVTSAGFLRLDVDTDPENMLPAHDPVRERNGALAETFGAQPTIVVGLFGEFDSVDTFAAMERVHRGLTEHPAVVASSTVSPASVMDGPPRTESDVAQTIQAINDNQLLAGNVLFANEPGGAIFVGLTTKSAADQVASLARGLIAAEVSFSEHEVEIAGQPLAQDAFGQQMFVQMAVFAPLAGLFVFAILYSFFRRLWMATVAMVVAMATVAITMGALLGSGNTLHIMSSMIPIFLMPIALLDAVHVLSEFVDRFDGRQRMVTIAAVMRDLERPIGYTSLTTAVGFAALALVPIPPVRVFGVFVALGVGVAWLLTMTLLPALLALIDVRHLSNYRGLTTERGWLMRRIPMLVTNQPWLVIGAFAGLAALAVPGLTQIRINDNPVRWFRVDHEIRQGSERLGNALPGISTANLVVTATEPDQFDQPATRQFLEQLGATLRQHPEVGAVQDYTVEDHPMLRSGGVANIRLQLRSGDNVPMNDIVELVDHQFASQRPPNLQLDWAGEAFLNLTWQEKMVSGMMTGLATTIVAIYFLLLALFRSAKWASLAIAPVLWTVLVVYGILAIAGRDFDMPLVVLSTMALGIGVDFAIHFVTRYKALYSDQGGARAALMAFYGEPARAISRNAIVIAGGFLPLALSSLVPYVIVGLLLAAIVTLAWLTSIFALPAAVTVAKRVLTPSKPRSYQ